MSMDYAGTELVLFAGAANWKATIAKTLRTRIVGDVLDVGAGIGGNIRPMMNPAVRSWTALEPDVALASNIVPTERVTVMTGTLYDLPRDRTFETILYLDVLEHIEDDRSELVNAARLVREGGHLIVLVPAHQFLFSPFDAAIGHFRRYDRSGMRALTPPGCRIELCRMLDSVGFFASLANRLLLRQAKPTATQIAAWDKMMVPLSRILDPLTGFRFGKSVLTVWRKSPDLGAKP